MARRNEEATIKLSADTKDVQAAFDKAADAYGALQKAAEEHARAVEATSKAVTDDEKAVAEAYEKATKKILKSETARSNALKKAAGAAKSQSEAMKGVASETKKATDATGKGGMSFGSMAAAAVAVGAAIAGVVNVTKEMTGSMIASMREGDANRDKLIALESAHKSLDAATLEGKKQLTLFVAELGKFGPLIMGPDGASKAMAYLNKTMGELQGNGMLMAQLFTSMAVNLESFDDAAKRLHAVNKQMAVAAKQRDVTKAQEKQVEANIKARIAAMEEAEQKRKVESEDAKRADEQAKERAKTDRDLKRRTEEQAKIAEQLRIQQEAEAQAAALVAQLKSDAAKIAVEDAQRKISQQEIYNQTLINEALARGEDITLLQSQLELEERLVEIRNSDMGTEEQARQARLAYLKQEVVALNEAAKAADKQKKEESDKAKQSESDTEMMLGNFESLAMASLAAADLQNVATALQSAKKVGFYGAEAIASFAAGNPVSGAGFLAAAAEHALNAGTAVAGMGKSGGGGGAAASPAESAPRSFGPTSMTVAEAREGSIVINQNMLSYIAPEDARRMASSEARESRATVGGRRR
jgi:hypothetical protein